MKIVLKDPVLLGEGEPIAELTMREKVVSGDLRGFKVSELGDPSVDVALKLAGRLCAQPDPVMARLSPRDTLEVIGAALGFFGSGLTDGKTP